MATAKQRLTDTQVQGQLDLLTPEQVARRLGVDIDYVKRRLIRTGKLTHIRIGRVHRVREEDLAAFILENRVAGHTYLEPSTLETRGRLRGARRK